MDAHPLEDTIPGKLLLLTCKMVTPLMLIGLLVITPAFVTREQLFQSAFWDGVLRLLVCALLVFLFWALPDLTQRFAARRQSWDTRIWVQLSAYDRGRMFQPVYLGVTVVFSLLVVLLTRWALQTFLPGTGAARWLLVIFLGLEMLVVAALQYPGFERSARQSAEPRALRSNVVVQRGQTAARPWRNSSTPGFPDEQPRNRTPGA